ncbi:MAG: cupredoxin domain-containing protein [Chloroflexi bacterium]|nr:cupredoxin domain-containing protein [Chloroflexota bacterium]
MLLAACAGSDGAGSSGEEMQTIAVSMTDELRFEPDAFTVSAGEMVRFEVTNDGESAHEFLIGDEAAQAEFEEAMQGGMDHETKVGVSLDPGQTESFEYTFDEAGNLLAGCHEPGHYDGGMVATITITD